MTMTVGRNERLAATIAPFLSFFEGSMARWNGDPSIANFAVGNPQEMPLPGYVEALRAALVPQDKDWFAYKLSEPRSQAAVARGLSARTGIDWDPADVAMTNGGFAALAVTIRAIVEPGDEVDLRVAAVVLLRAPHRVRRRDPGPGPVHAARLRPRHRGDRGRHHPAHPSGADQLAAQPDRPDLPDRGAPRARRDAGAAVGRARSPDRPHLRRAVQPDRLRRDHLPQPGRGLPQHDHDLLLRQDAAGARDAHRLRHVPADDAAPRGAAAGGDAGPAVDGLLVPERAPPARDRGPRTAVDRHRGARATTRPVRAGTHGRWATRRRCRKGRST